MAVWCWTSQSVAPSGEFSKVDRYGQQSIDCFRTYLNNILTRPGPFTDPDSWNADVLEKAKVLSVVSNQYL